MQLVAPGGSYTKALTAAHYGADAVYLGVPYTSLRMRQNKVKDFDILQQTINELHDLGKKAFLTMNIFPRNTDIKIFEAITEKVSSLGADGIIFGDPGTYMTLKKYMPHQHYHLSTQTNTLNYEAVKFRQDLGVKRIVLARELHITEIAEIKKHVPDMELEVFVHGAMCIAYSGRCLLGEYFSGRDGNKGECSHVCRYNFNVSIEEKKRPGKKIDLVQDEYGTNMLSSRDLCAIQKLDQLTPYVDAIKIEGRSKGEFYVGSVCKAYRHALDCLSNNKTPDPDTINLVYQIPHRKYREGFLFQDLKKDFPDGENIGPSEPIPLSAQLTNNKKFGDRTMDSAGPIVQKEYFGFVHPQTSSFPGKDESKAGNIMIAHRFTPKQTIYKDDTLEYLTPQTIGTLTITELYNKEGKILEKIDCNTSECYITTDKKLQGWEIFYSNPVNY